MKHLVTLLFPLFLLAETSIIIGGITSHFKPCEMGYSDTYGENNIVKTEQVKCNENNNIFGIQQSVFENLSITAMKFKNSYYWDSEAFLINLHKDVKYGKVKFNIGVVNGYGYEWEREDFRLMGSVSFEKTYKRFGLDVGMTPKFVYVIWMIKL